MPTLQAASIPDILVAGLQELGEGQVTDLTVDTQHHVAFSILMKKSHVDLQSSGYGTQWDLMIDHNHSTRAVGLYSVDNVNQVNLLTQASIPWRHLESHYAFDHHEVDFNKGPRQIVDLIKARRYGCMVGMAEFFEDRFWRLTAADDDRNMLGIPNWIVKNATEGFTGTVPSGFTTVAGLSPTTVARWANYAAPYTSVDVTDLIPKIERAMDLTLFKPPTTAMKSFNTGDQYGLFTNYTVFQAAKQILRGQNEDMGSELDPFQRPVFRGTPLQWVPQLAIDTTNPVYGINWGEVKLAILRNWWMKETVLDRMPGQHNVSAVFMDNSLNTICRNRRRCFVISNGTTLPQ